MPTKSSSSIPSVNSRSHSISLNLVLIMSLLFTYVTKSSSFLTSPTITRTNAFVFKQIPISRKPLSVSYSTSPPPPPLFKNYAKTPYILGLTGGIATGKSTIARHLVKNFNGLSIPSSNNGDKIDNESSVKIKVVHIDTDSLASYKPGSVISENVIALFRDIDIDILTSTPSKTNPNEGEGESEERKINRNKLSKAVFTSPVLLTKLEDIVWPFVLTQIESVIDSEKTELCLASSSSSSSPSSSPHSSRTVIVLEAAALTESGWDNLLCDFVINALSSSSSSEGTNSAQLQINRVVKYRKREVEEALRVVKLQEERKMMRLQASASSSTGGKDKVEVFEVVNNGNLRDLKTQVDKVFGQVFERIMRGGGD